MATVLYGLGVFLSVLYFSVSQKLGSIVYDVASKQYTFVDSLVLSNMTVATGNFTQATNETGWSYLEITTNENFDDSVQSYAAGYLEAQLTRDMIYMHWQNTIVGDPCVPDSSSQLCQKLKALIDINFNWIFFSGNKTDTYWHQISLFLAQLRGLEASYYNFSQHFVIPSILPHINPFGLLLLQIDGDMNTLYDIYHARERDLGSGSCSALIKLLSGYTDLYVAHDTWSTYQSMLKILKKYDFAFHVGPGPSQPLIPGRVMTFSSYPGVMLSGDDFYLLSSGLASLETTIENKNPNLNKKVYPVDSVFENIRVIVANRLAVDGHSWVDLFSKYNSGTYNNQWMIVDYKQFVPGKQPTSDLLWVVEQMPGVMKAEDMTSHLTSTMYWPSYNLAFFKDIQEISWAPKMVEKYGDFFSYSNSPRAKIFLRDQGKVHDLDSMTKLMRYNDFKNDPLARCNCTPPFSAENGISARCDLNPATGTYPIHALGHREHGGTDMKLTSSLLFKSLQFRAVAGPTTDQQPPFQWSTSDFAHLPHLGHPDVFNFQPITHQWYMKKGFPKFTKD